MYSHDINTLLLKFSLLSLYHGVCSSIYVRISVGLCKYTRTYIHVQGCSQKFHLHCLSSALALLEVQCPLLVALYSLFAVDLCGTKILSIALFLRLNWVYICLYMLTLKLTELGVFDLHFLLHNL